MADFGAAEKVELTRDLTESQKAIFNSQYSSERKDPGTMVLLALIGYDRFWLGDTGLGMVKLVTCNGCGIWGLVDIFSAKSRAEEYNRNKAQEIVDALKATGK